MRSQIRAEEAKTWPSTVFNTSSLPTTAAEYPGHVEAELDRAELDKVTVICGCMDICGDSRAMKSGRAAARPRLIEPACYAHQVSYSMESSQALTATQISWSTTIHLSHRRPCGLCFRISFVSIVGSSTIITCAGREPMLGCEAK